MAFAGVRSAVDYLSFLKYIADIPFPNHDGNDSKASDKKQVRKIMESFFFFFFYWKNI
jgi:hypothetical protein